MSDQRNPFRSEDERIQRVIEEADEKLASSEYDAAINLYDHMLLLEPENLRAKINIATANALKTEKQYDMAAFGAWSDAIVEAKKRYFDYTGESQDYIDVIGKEIELFEHVAVTRAEKAREARTILARKFEADDAELRKLYTPQTINDEYAKSRLQNAR